MSDSTDDEAETKRKPGRPVGARNKTTLMKAQILIDDLSETAVEYLEALMKNDLVLLNSKGDVPYSIRFSATKEILAKGIANEKEKDAPKPVGNATTTDENGQKIHQGPQVYATAAAS